LGVTFRTLQDIEGEKLLVRAVDYFVVFEGPYPRSREYTGTVIGHSRRAMDRAGDYWCLLQIWSLSYVLCNIQANIAIST
jgi:hypothetical protein